MAIPQNEELKRLSQTQIVAVVAQTISAGDPKAIHQWTETLEGSM